MVINVAPYQLKSSIISRVRQRRKEAFASREHASLSHSRPTMRERLILWTLDGVAVTKISEGIRRLVRIRRMLKYNVGIEASGS